MDGRTQRVAGQLGPWTTRPVDSSARSGQLGPYVPDNAARRCNYSECLSREYNKILVIYCLFDVIFIIFMELVVFQLQVES